MKISIVGAGALGSSYGFKLIESGNDVTFIDGWSENVRRLNEDGLTVNDMGEVKNVKVKAYSLEDANEKADFVLVFTKSMQLESTLNKVKNIFHENTKILCLLNGLGHTDTLKKFFKPENIFMGVTVLTASMTGPASAAMSSHGKTEIQNIVAQGIDGAKQVVELINNSGLPSVYSEDILFSIWRKAALNGCLNSSCTILESNMYQLGQVPGCLDYFKQIVSEFAAVAKKIDNVDLDVEEIAKFIYGFTDKGFAGSVHHPSMYQDLIKNRRLTEIDFLNGYISKKGRELKIATPYCDLITFYVHGKEKIMGVE